MSMQQSLLAILDEQQETIRRFRRARNAISGLDEEGNKIGPGWLDAHVISLAHGEGIRRPHPDVIAAGIQALLDTKQSSLDNYLYLRPFKSFEDKIVETFVHEGINEATARNICIDSGNTRLFYGFFYAVANPGDIFLAPQTFYQAVSMWADISKVVLACVETQHQHDYKFTRQDLEAWYERYVYKGKVPKPKGLLLFNPSYTGAIYTSKELQELAAFIEEHNLVVLEDSIFTSTEFDGYKTAHLASCEGMTDRVVTVNGGSKAYGLANIRIGWGCGPSEIISRMNYFTMSNSITVPHIAKAMALAALNAPQEYLDGNIQECKERAILVSELVSQVNEAVNQAIGFAPQTPLLEIAHWPKGGHSTLLSANGTQDLNLPDGSQIRDSVDVTRHFLSEGAVCFSPGISNGFDDCTIRVCFGCLGSEYTYEETREAEVSTAVLEVCRQMKPHITVEQVTKCLQMLGIKPLWMFDSAHNEGFKSGRAILREAFLERIAPAAIRLAIHNRDRLHP